MAVRVAVVKGLTFVLDNHLAHAFLRKLLPTLRQMIHDPSSRVRDAMVDLLLVTKGIRDVKVCTSNTGRLCVFAWGAEKEARERE